MVQSKIDTSIQYKDDEDMNLDDIGSEVSLYEYELYKKDRVIALGKAKYTYTKSNVIYFFIYLIVHSMPVATIGVFEANTNDILNILDDDGDVMLDKGSMLLYKFVNKEYLDGLEKGNETNESIDPYVKTIERAKDEIDVTEGPYTLDGEVEDESDVTKLRLPKQSLSKTLQKTEKALHEGVFTLDPSKKQPLVLEEENEEIANTMKNQFREALRNTWIEMYMKNNHYNIIDNEGGGDCFFAVIRDAFEQIGQTTSVEKLRALLAKSATDDTYQENRTLYVNFLTELQAKDKEMKELKKQSIELKRRNAQTKNAEEGKVLKERAKELIAEFEKLKLEKEEIKEWMTDFQYMADLNTFEKFRSFVLTPNFWADTWTVSEMEKLLNIKVIILSNQAYDAGDLDSVLQCGQLNDRDLEKQGKFTPDYYIMMSYLGDHYKLITYKDKRIFKFTELPYDIKSLVINKCMERNAGPYYLIQDFRHLKTKLGLLPDEGAPVQEDEDEEIQHDLYDPNTVFVFYSKSNDKPKAGHGSGETISKERTMNFNALNKDKDCKDWRRKLDDSWPAPFTIDGRRWGTVEHYHMGSQYKKGFPTFYQEFALDSESNISKDLSVAKAAVSKSGRLKDKVLRTKNIIPDADFYADVNDPAKASRDILERETALEAKFTQNLDLRKVLVETKNAKLVHFVRSEPPIVDLPLMKLRSALVQNRSM
jgi:predicted NAD-dependent protein-ADP-ribosyltransferase YbiA (DUF1768 family)